MAHLLMGGKRGRAFTPGNLDAGSTNASTSMHVSPNILESFIPGYSLISAFILSQFGFDIGILVSTGVLLAGIATAGHLLWRRMGDVLKTYCTVSIHVRDQDDFYHSVLHWIRSQQIGKEARSLVTVADSGGYGRYGFERSREPDVDFVKRLFHSKLMRMSPPEYDVWFGSYWFFRHGRFFMFDRTRKERSGGGRMPWDKPAEEESAVFTTFGFSTEPIKKLLIEIKEWDAEERQTETIVRRPTFNNRGGGSSWSRMTTRPNRPLETVVLDPRQKASLVADINEYLLPTTKKWYARRGIPYRRGILFWGAPGTGKSSLSFALAGLFGLPLHLISLLDPQLTEADLMALFNNLPERCIVLLEDIDSAGFKRSPGDEESAAKDTKAAVAKTTTNKRGRGMSDEPASNGISLSGLLNAIDGVGSQEGRVLVMTTNHPEKLDEALVRPGRIDLKVQFTLCSKHQAREIFYRMYMPSRTLTKDIDKPHKSGDKPKSTMMENFTEAANDFELPEGLGVGDDTREMLLTMLQKRHAIFTEDELKGLATKFADRVPENQFSPAEVQNFLIARKKDPRSAVEQIEEWVGETLKQKVKAKQEQEERERKEQEDREKKEKEEAEAKAKKEGEETPDTPATDLSSESETDQKKKRKHKKK